MTSPKTLHPRLSGDQSDQKATATKDSVALISLRFRPAFVSHLVAFAKAFQELGFEVEFIVDLAYERFPDLKVIAPITPYSSVAVANGYTYALFANVSLRNQRLARQLKHGGTRILYLYHEPRHPSSTFAFFRDAGFYSGIVGSLAHVVSVSMLKLADRVILPSKHAAAVYRQRDVRHNSAAFCVPLLFDDEARAVSTGKAVSRKYFSYVGAICHSHGFDHFLGFMRESFIKRWNIEFLIASHHSLPPSVLRDPVIAANLDKIKVRCGRPLQNEEINRYYAESFGIWNVYRTSMQSGVLPKAFMFGTPVVASETGSFTEFVRDRVNGRFALPADVEGIRAAVDDFRERTDTYAANCRTTFLETFFYKANLSELERVLK